MFERSEPFRIDLRHAIRTVSFENPSGAKGAAATAHGGRKGAPLRMLKPGERVVLADLAGAGCVRHFWLTFPPLPPHEMRAPLLEIHYDDAREPSVSVPVLDFFGCPLGRPVASASQWNAAQEGRGFNSWLPLPFRRRMRVEFVNATARRFPLYYQIAFTEGALPEDAGLLHVAWHRENPTQLKRDFTIAAGLRGPGRFFGCNVGIRVLPEEGFQWYGEGEVKVYLDGDRNNPTWCGTGLEDYVGSAWGMGAHATPLQGAPLILQAPGAPMPEWVSFYRWHDPDPIVFERELRVTLQQIGAVPVPKGDLALRDRLERAGRVAGGGWFPAGSALEAFGICERQDDVCATAFLYLRDAQPVPRVDPALACADLERRAWEQPNAFESALSSIAPPG
ncbi:MAG TPA: glycoside hydrolase family 172 protein [Myxococcota bacterium]|nr:glycoside hydrolase family 172 protein [Myxococcota bacterium]